MVTNPKNTRVIYKHMSNSVLPVVPVISERDLHGFASTISDALAICTKARAVLEDLQKHSVAPVHFMNIYIYIYIYMSDNAHE